MFETVIKADIQKLAPVLKISDNVFTQDSQGNKITVEVTDGGEAVELEGTVQASIIKPDGTTITATGDKDGNKAWVVLPEQAYSVPGKLSVFIKLINDPVVETLGGIETTVYKSR